MNVLFILSLLLPTAWAQVSQEQQLQNNIAVYNQQAQELMKRLTEGDECDQVFQPLPGANGSLIYFHTATAVLEANIGNLQDMLSEQCMGILLQNLAQTNDPGSQRLMRSLASMVSPVSATPVKNQLACSAEPLDLPAIKNLTDSMKEIAECGTVKVGQGKRVRDTTPWGRKIDYMLFQERKDQFRAVLNIDYKANNSSITSAQMLARARGCLAAASGSLKGPNGQSLKIDILAPSEMDSLNVKAGLESSYQTVNIDPANVGSHASNYQEHITCPTLVHETLHLLGLCDEYSGERDGFACRPPSPQTSIMNAQDAAFNLAVPRRVTCECEDKDLCRKLKEHPDVRKFMQIPRFDQITNARFRNNYCREYELDSDIVEKWLKDNNNHYPADPTRVRPLQGGGVQFDELTLDEDGDFVGRRFECSCEAGDRVECQKAAQALISGPRTPMGHDCPAFTRPASVTWGAAPVPSTATDKTFTFNVTPPSTASLLMPGHFAKITGGACDSKAPRYNTCSNFSYERDPARCEEAPNYCKSSDWLQEGTP